MWSYLDKFAHIQNLERRKIQSNLNCFFIWSTVSIFHLTHVFFVRCFNWHQTPLTSNLQAMKRAVEPTSCSWSRDMTHLLRNKSTSFTARYSVSWFSSNDSCTPHIHPIQSQIIEIGNERLGNHLGNLIIDLIEFCFLKPFHPGAYFINNL